MFFKTKREARNIKINPAKEEKINVVLISKNSIYKNYQNILNFSVVFNALFCKFFSPHNETYH